MQNGALQDYPLDEDDLENFYIRNLSRFVVFTLGSQGLPRSFKGLPRGSQGAPKGSLGWGGGSQGLQGALIIGNCSF